MKDQILVQYIGFEAKPLTREYTFAVREAANEPLQYTVSIANDAFSDRRVRFQDAAEICSQRLRRELDTFANHPPTTSFDVTDTELATFRDAHKPKPTHGFQSAAKVKE